MRMLDPFYFISSRGVGRLFTHKVSVVLFGQTGFALKIKLKCLGSKVPEIFCISGKNG